MNWKKILFLILFLSFLIFGPYLIFYSQGIRFDFQKKKFVKTGAIFIKAIPTGASVFLDGKLIKKTDFVFGSAKIENLMPKVYKIKIEKEGYFPWEKELEVKEKMVTEIKEKILFPKSLKIKKIKNENEVFEKGNLCQKFEKECQIKEGVLYLKGEEGFEKIFENLKGFAEFSKKFALFSDHEIWLFENERKNFLLRDSKEIKDVAFLNENYLAFLTQDSLKIVETDLRDGLNIYELLKIEGEKVKAKEKSILILKGDEIFEVLLF